MACEIFNCELQSINDMFFNVSEEDTDHKHVNTSDVNLSPDSGLLKDSSSPREKTDEDNEDET